MSPAHQALARAIDAASGQVALASAIGTTQSNVWTWLHKNKRGTPAEWVIPIEVATKVPRHELRPDLYPPPEGAPASPQPSPKPLTPSAAEREPAEGAAA